jgi:hypothetical protein
MNFWQYLSELTSGKASMLSPMLKLLTILFLGLLPVSRIPDSSVACRDFLYYTVAGCIAAVVFVVLCIFSILMLGTKKISADRNAMRSESHIKDIMDSNVTMAKLREGVLRN